MAREGFDERGHVEDVAEAFAIGLEQQRERWIARGDAEQIVGTLAQLPERRAGIGAAARQQQCAAGGFAKAAGEESRGAELAQNELHGFSGFDEEPVGIGRLVGVGKAEDEAVVAPEGFDFRSAGGADARADGHGPGNVNAAAKGSEHADAPVAELVADSAR